MENQKSFYALLVRILVLVLLLLFLPLGLLQIDAIQKEGREEYCLYGTECWDNLSFADKLRIQRYWRNGKPLEEME